MTKEPMHRMAVSLRSRMSMVGDMAAGTYWALVEHGLALPSQRAIADKCGYSAATLSRRLQGRSLDDVVVRLCDARDRTFPWTAHAEWADWLPEDAEDRADARVWSACLQIAQTSDPVARAVAVTSENQRLALARQAGLGSTRIDALHALIDGLTARMLVDRDFDHARALATLGDAVDAWAAAPTPSGADA